MRNCIIAFSVISVFLIPNTYGGIVWFLDDLEAWQGDSAPPLMIEFTGFPPNTTITDQYANIGVNFDNFVTIHESALYSDGWGLFGHDGILFTLTTPHHAVAVEFLGSVSLALYNDGDFVGSVGNFPNPDIEPRFVGIVSEAAFNQVYLFKPPPFTNHVGIDNLYWGMPIPAPGALGLFALAAIGARRRRR